MVNALDYQSRDLKAITRFSGLLDETFNRCPVSSPYDHGFGVKSEFTHRIKAGRTNHIISRICPNNWVMIRPYKGQFHFIVLNIRIYPVLLNTSDLVRKTK